MSTKAPATGTPVRISFTAVSVRQARDILDHLTEERLVAGGTIVQAESVNWVGGELTRTTRKVATAYTTMGKLPFINGRLETLYGEEAPLLSQFAMAGEKKSVLGWIERNVRE